MKVFGLCGSARKDGNTALLMRTVFDVLEKHGIETELYQLAGKQMNPCRACFTCGGKGTCSFRQDAFDEVFRKVREADGILLGSPVYLANVSSSMQAFLERAAVVADMNPGMLRHKVGAAVAAARRGGALCALDAMNHFFLNHEMFLAGASYWTLAFGQLPGDVKADAEGLATMTSLGENMAFLLQKLHIEEEMT